MLIGVFDNPLRFRLDLMGADLTEWYGETTGNRFLDEIQLHAPFDELILQCRATVEGCVPTYYRRTAAGKGGADHPGGYARLLLPLWGNGRIGMLLGAVVLDKAARKTAR
jgi:hypothetical protein